MKIRRASSLILIGILAVGLLVSPFLPYSPSFAVPNSQPAINEAPQSAPVEVLVQRTRNSKTYDLGNGKFAVDASLGAVHYKDAQSNWQNINNRIVGGVMTEADYTFRLLQNTFNAGQIVEFARSGEYVRLQPMELQYSNALNQIQSISMPQAVTGTVTNTPVQLLPGVDSEQGKVKWLGAYGTNRDFEWTTTSQVLSQLLKVGDSLPNPEQFILDGGNPVLKLNFILAPSSGLDIYINGSLWDKRTKTQTIDYIEFKQGEVLLWSFFPVRYWDSEGSEGIGTTELSKSGNNLYVSTLVPYAWLQTATYPIFIDPDTGAKYPTTSASVSEPPWSDNNWSTITNIYADDGANAYIDATTYDSGDQSRVLKANGFNFSSIPDGATIDGVIVRINTSYWNGTVSIDLAQLLDTTAVRVGTNKYATPEALSDNPDDIKTAGGATDKWGNALTPAWVKNANFGVGIGMLSTGTDSDVFVDYVTIQIYYTAGGVVAPTVTSVSSSSVEETTATATGNVTATGGENVTSRLIQYGTASLTYTANVSESGSWDVGSFSLGLTSLSPGTTYYWRAGANNTAGYGYGSELTFTTKPQAPTGLSATAQTNNQITLSWTLGSGSENTTVRYRTDTYPTSYTDGTLGYSGTASSANITSLSPSMLYYFGAWAVNTDNSTIYSDSSAQVSTWTRPGDPTNLIASNPQYTTVDLDWTLATSANRSHIRWATGSYPTSISEGTQAYFASDNNTIVTSLPEATQIYFNMWFYSDNSTLYSSDNYSTTVTTLTPSAPTVTTSSATDISYTTVTASGNITDTGGDNATERGFQYGIGGYTDNVSEAGDFSTGVFTLPITGLQDNTLYQYRTYAINSAGIGYGNLINFTTLEIVAPTVTSSAATSITASGATLHGNVTATGGGNYETRIFEWGYPSGNYTDNWTSVGSYGTGTFSQAISGLSANTTYYWRAGAINNGDAGYSGELSFATLEAPSGGAPATPMNFRGIITSDNELILLWDSAPGATDYLVRMSLFSYPSDPAGNDSITYNGTATSVTLSAREWDFTPYYFSLWAHVNPYSDVPAELTVGGGNTLASEVANLVTTVTEMTNNLTLVLYFLPLVFFSVLGFWRTSAIGFLMAAGASIIVGLVWYDVDVTTRGLAIGLLFMGYSLACLGLAFGAMFSRGKSSPSEE